MSSQRFIKKDVLQILVAISFGLLLGCGSSKETLNLSAEERFELGKKKFENGDYSNAIEDFRVITLQFPGSVVADSAQLYLGDSYFRRDQFILAASEYETLVRTMPNSKLVPNARFQVGLCYNSLSPASELDQSQTLKAIDAFQTFIEYHPTNSLVREAEAKILELHTKLAKKEYDSGVIYMKMDYYRAAATQFDLVLEKYHDTEYAPPALLGKVEALIARKRYSEAKGEVEKFFEKYPNSPLLGQAQSLKVQIEDNLQGATRSKAEGGSPMNRSASKIEIK